MRARVVPYSTVALHRCATAAPPLRHRRNIHYLCGQRELAPFSERTSLPPPCFRTVPPPLFSYSPPPLFSYSPPPLFSYSPPPPCFRTVPPPPCFRTVPPPCFRTVPPPCFRTVPPPCFRTVPQTAAPATAQVCANRPHGSKMLQKKGERNKVLFVYNKYFSLQKFIISYDKKKTI